MDVILHDVSETIQQTYEGREKTRTSPHEYAGKSPILSRDEKSDCNRPVLVYGEKSIFGRARQNIVD